MNEGFVAPELSCPSLFRVQCRFVVIFEQPTKGLLDPIPSYGHEEQARERHASD
jgi:hypothetical protein